MFVLICILFSYSRDAYANIVKLVNDPIMKLPNSKFDCRQKIYVYIQWERLKQREHFLEAEWINPKGKLQEHTFYKFKGDEKESWLMLKLNGEGGSKLMKSFDPTFGYEDFIGFWSVNIYLDDKLIETKSFFVAC